MNRAQKVAWFNLIGSFISAVLMALLGYVFLSGPTAEKFHLLRQLVFMLASVLVLVHLLFFAFVLRKKQKAAEPDVDERDRQISKKSIRVTFVAACILMFLATALPMWMLGLDSSIPVAALPLINVGVFLCVLAIYNTVVLPLYRMKGGVV